MEPAIAGAFYTAESLLEGAVAFTQGITHPTLPFSRFLLAHHLHHLERAGVAGLALGLQSLVDVADCASFAIPDHAEDGQFHVVQLAGGVSRHDILHSLERICSYSRQHNEYVR